MDEEVLAAVVGGYKTEPLLVIEPLHRSAQPLTHCLDLFFACFFSLCVCFSHKRRENPNKPKSPFSLSLSICEGVSLTESLA